MEKVRKIFATEQKGIPDWAVRIDKDARPFAEPIGKVPLDDKGYPDMDECQSRVFSIYYLSQVVGNAFQNFYDDVDGIATAFGKFWSTVASHFRDHNSVLAYELINEPVRVRKVSHQSGKETSLPIPGSFIPAKLNE